MSCIYKVEIKKKIKNENFERLSGRRATSILPPPSRSRLSLSPRDGSAAAIGGFPTAVLHGGGKAPIVNAL